MAINKTGSVTFFNLLSTYEFLIGVKVKCPKENNDEIHETLNK